MVTFGQKELQRVKVMENIVAGRITVRQGAELLGVSRRQTQRWKKRHRVTGVEWVRHGNRGRPPANRVSQRVREQVLNLARGKYAGFNDSHLHEKITKIEKLKLSRQSVRRILRGAGIASPQKRRPPRYRSRRERRPQEGMMLLTDGSRHDWLEGRGPELTLLGYIDDATSRVPAARFQRESEDAAGYLRITRQVVERHGIPLSIYRDRHGIFQRNDAHWSMAEELAGEQAPTQMGRVFQELGIESIAALSPQAKGRIERLWRTFQDRLRSELRLAQASCLEQANQVLQAFLVEYNNAFARPAVQSGSAYRSVPRHLDLDYIFSLRDQRTVNGDHTLSIAANWKVQLPLCQDNADTPAKEWRLRCFLPVL